MDYQAFCVNSQGSSGCMIIGAQHDWGALIAWRPDKITVEGPVENCAGRDAVMCPSRVFPPRGVVRHSGWPYPNAKHGSAQSQLPPIPSCPWSDSAGSGSMWTDACKAPPVHYRAADMLLYEALHL